MSSGFALWIVSGPVLPGPSNNHTRFLDVVRYTVPMHLNIGRPKLLTPERVTTVKWCTASNQTEPYPVDLPYSRQNRLVGFDLVVQDGSKLPQL